MAARRAPRRYILLGVGLGALALAIAGGTWLAVATPQFEKVGPGLMTVALGGGPLVTHSRPGQPAEAVLWQEMKGTPLKLQEVQIMYAFDDENESPVTAYIRVAEDASGQRWLQAAQGCDPLVPSPDRSSYFFEHYGQLYLVDTKTLEVSPLSSWEYQGKSRVRLVKEQNRPIGWVVHTRWTPDGRSVVFVTNRSGQDEAWRLDLATREEAVVARCVPGHRWALHSWAADGRLLVQEVSGQAIQELFLLNLATGATEQLLRTDSFDVSGPYIFYQSPEPDAGCLLYDINRRRSAPVPPPPEGHTYSMPMSVCPGGTRFALWLQTMDIKRLVGIIDMTVDPPALQTYEPPGRPRSAGALMWIDEETVVVQSGDKSDPGAATYALKVGGVK